MESGDGLLVRIRGEARGLSSASLRALAQLSAQYGNGTIDLTRRANLQLRGVQPGTLAPLQAALQAAGLCAASQDEEARQLLWVSPFADLSPDCAELRAPAAAIESALYNVELAQPLSAKFLILLQGGGSRALDLPCDLRIDIAAEESQRAHLSAACENDRGTYLGSCLVTELTPVVTRLLALLSQLGPNQRMRALLDQGQLATLRAGLDDTAPPIATQTASLAHFIGAQPEGFVGLGVPFGSGDARLWSEMASLAARFGDGTVRFTPLRTLVFPRVRESNALLEAAHSLGLITRVDDVLLRVVACPGAPACAAAYGETRALARELADTLHTQLAQGATLHVSGCAKGCAQSAPADFTLVHDRDGAKLGRARSARSTAEQPAQPLFQLKAQLAQEASSAQPKPPSPARS